LESAGRRPAGHLSVCPPASTLGLAAFVSTLMYEFDTLNSRLPRTQTLSHYWYVFRLQALNQLSPSSFLVLSSVRRERCPHAAGEEDLVDLPNHHVELIVAYGVVVAESRVTVGIANADHCAVPCQQVRPRQ
jgi:hypothetical protein